jgi:CHAT domain-containing protein
MTGRSHVHLACHGDFDELNPFQTRLILNSADPEMTIRIGDIVRATPESGCAIVLSACETGMLHQDRGGEHLGLPTTFALAGASAVIGAAWPVGDLPNLTASSEFISIPRRDECGWLSGDNCMLGARATHVQQRLS